MKPAETVQPAEPAPLQNGAIVVELKKQSRKQIRRFRQRMEGKLAVAIQDTLQSLKSSGKISENAQPVVFVVRQKPDINGLFSW